MAYPAISNSIGVETAPRRKRDPETVLRQSATPPAGPNGAHALQAMAEAAMLEIEAEAQRWSPRAALAATGVASAALWTLLGVVLF